MSEFGDFLRAARLGFRRLSPPMPPVWMRVEAGGPPWRVQIAWDARQMGDLTPGRSTYVAWWEGDTSEAEIHRRVASTSLPGRQH